MSVASNKATAIRLIIEVWNAGDLEVAAELVRPDYVVPGVGQGDAGAVHDQVVLGTGLAPVRRVRSDRLAPLFARTLKESMSARVQWTVAPSPNELRSVSCSRWHWHCRIQQRVRLAHAMQDC
jgi:hypothetical protein